MICPRCKGEGKLPIFNVEHPFITCHFCDGKKEVPDDCKEWIMKGSILKSRRLKKRLILRKAGLLLKMNPLRLSDMELGKVEPDMSITYDTIKTIKQ